MFVSAFCLLKMPFISIQAGERGSVMSEERCWGRQSEAGHRNGAILLPGQTVPPQYSEGRKTRGTRLEDGFPLPPA